MDDDLDRLLADPLLAPPEGFVDAVLWRAAQRQLSRTPARWRVALQWLALVGVGTPVAVELASFAMAMWTISSAG